MSLVFESSEMGSGELVTAFHLVPVGSRPDIERNCQPLQTPIDSIETNRGIRPGLRRDRVDQLLGKQGRDSADVTLYMATRDSVFVRAGKRLPYTQSSGFVITFKGNRATSIYGWRVDAA